MFEQYQTKLDRLVHAALNSPGVTDPALRRAILERSKDQAADRTPAPDAVPPDLVEFVDKIAYSPRDVTDQDFAGLRTAGYSEDAILEIMNCASLAAGIGRLEVVRAASQ
jgi:hypothetical protein